MRADARKNHDRLLAVARTAISQQGTDASLRDIARRAGVGLGTLYRHFPTREALLESLLPVSFEDLAARAEELETSSSAKEALVSWLRETVALAHKYRGVTATMLAAIENPNSALHAPCVTMRAVGTRLLTRAQEKRIARGDIDGADLYALIGALSWLAEQPSTAPRANHLFGVVSSAILVDVTPSKRPRTRRRRIRS